jgi:hypothetical protein
MALNHRLRFRLLAMHHQAKVREFLLQLVALVFQLAQFIAADRDI